MGTRLMRFVVLVCAGLFSSACSVATYGGGVGREDVVESVVATPWQEIGRSVEGRPIRLRTIGSGARRVLWVGGIHGNEVEWVIATEELPAAFAGVRGLSDRVTLTIVEDVNPDGRAARSRGNAHGIDLNRNYPARNFAASPTNGDEPLCEPESRVLHDLIVRLDPHVVIVAHSWGRRADGPPCFINFDGPAEHLARRFGELSGYAVVPSENIHGTPGSLGSFVGIDRRTPILTLEYERGRSPDRCWSETREAILAVIGGDTGSGS
ncbi:MAG: M14 family zinc carboxypeptidase [Planctomycetota bacterium]|nr:M14 family zinc carboxypeptidase [Planctomycetota bacterium]